MIDVIIPVYAGAAQTRRCIESVVASRQAGPFETVVVDDATPEPEIAAYLDGLAQEGRITLLRNPANIGFVQSVNRGMALHSDRDVVLLNSDTEVANDWLDRLHACAHAQPDVATVTPFSNNATICSYPFEGWADGVPGTLGLAALDRLFAVTNAGQSLELPTAVGFCMYIRRDSLAQLGLFDAARFGRGYGEENDYSMRAAKAGWRNVMACDVFVFHEGAVSFSGERGELTQAATKALLEVHPDYPFKVHDFLVRDPPGAYRAAIDAARVAHDPEEAKHVLAERYAERVRLMGGLWEIERLAADRDSKIGQLNRGLEHVKEQVAARDRIIGEKEDEIAKLRAGLSHAEFLAFERERELDRVYNSRRWRFMHFVLRWIVPDKTRGVS